MARKNIVVFISSRCLRALQYFFYRGNRCDSVTHPIHMQNIQFLQLKDSAKVSLNSIQWCRRSKIKIWELLCVTEERKDGHLYHHKFPIKVGGELVNILPVLYIKEMEGPCFSELKSYFSETKV